MLSGVEAHPPTYLVDRPLQGGVHTAIIYGITGRGAERALYDQLFKPSEVAHDVPLLAAM